MTEQRPDPDQLLKRLQAEERQANVAKLKIFFGPYPGVGKTYAMLQAAKERKEEGVDLVVGIVETHGRPETAALLEGLEILPRREIPYKGITLKEFDLEAALKRKPELLVIDELAHTNPPDSRHAKRWQDVEELLDAGISVYTTLNVQHWESLNDVIAQITGVRVKETVPDSFLQRANEVELVDLPPADLLKRMSEGKVYMGTQAVRAAENFFQIGNLIALRELALRHTAERVDAEMQEFKSLHGIERVLPVSDRLMVGITASPHSRRLIRATLRLATSLRCDWIAVYVQTPEHDKLPPDQKARIVDTLRLAERLGGETAVITGQNVPEEMLRYARRRNVTKIVLGKPSRPRWKEFLLGSTLNKIAHESKEIDLYVISASGVPDEKMKIAGVPKQKAEPFAFWQSLLLICLCTFAGYKFLPFLDRTNLVMFYLLVVVLIAYKYGRKAGITASILSVLFFDFFLVPPYLTFAVSDTEYIITFAVMLAVALFISTITGRLVSLAEATREREARLGSLNRLSQALLETPETGKMLQLAWKELEDYYRCPVLLLVPEASGELRVAAGESEKFAFQGNEILAAEWVYRNGEIAGKGTDTLAGVAGTYVPLMGHHKTVGVLAIRQPKTEDAMSPESLHLLETFAAEIGKALESKELSEAAGRATASMEAERFKNLVLRSFAYDLAAPAEDIVANIEKVTRLNARTPEYNKVLQIIREKSEQIQRVTSKLPSYLRETFGTQSENPATETRQKTERVDSRIPLAAYLTPDQILFLPDGQSRRKILERLISTIPVPNPAMVLRSLEEREEVGGIFLRPNVVIPHTRLEGMTGVMAVLGIQEREEQEPLFWLLFVSGEESIQEHLNFLRSAAQAFTDRSVQQLSMASTPEEVLQILSETKQPV